MRDSPWTQWVYLYHNTCVTDGPGLDGYLFNSYWWYWTNIVARNNIFVGTRYALRNVNEECPIDFDFDHFFTSDPGHFIEWHGATYASLAEFSAVTGQERHGFAVDPRFVAPGDPRLRSDSPLIDVGLRLPGINDGFLGRAPDLGAFEMTSTPVALSVAVVGGSTETTWRVTPGSPWQLEVTLGLSPPNWTDAGAPVTAVEALLVLKHPNPAASGFYRLRSANE